MDTATIFRQGSLVVRREHDAIVVTFGTGAEARVLDDGDVRWSRRDDDDAVAVADVVVETLRRRRQRAFHLHAGVVEQDNAVTVVGGASGAGKTTTTLALALAPGAVLRGDDVAFAGLDGDAVVVEALPRPLHVGVATQRMFPGLVARPGAHTALGKAIVDATLPPPRPLPVARLVFPAIADVATTTATALPPAQALARLMVASASVAWPLPGTDAHLDVLGRLAAVPAVELTLGRDALDDAAVIVRAVRAAAAARPR